MPSIEDVVQTELLGPLQAQWMMALSQAVPRVLGEYAIGLLDCEAITTNADWNSLDDPLSRAQKVVQSPLLPELCGRFLQNQVNHLRRAIIDAGFERQTGASISRRIATVTPALLQLPASIAELTASPFAQSWRFVADALARQVYVAYQGRLPTVAPEEWKLINRLILVDYFRQCRLPEARLVGIEVTQATRGLLSIRGTLVSTANSVSATGAEGNDLPIGGPPSAAPLSLSGLSDGLASLNHEMTATAANNGVMRRLTARFMTGIPPTLRQARLRSFTRYENSLLAYIAVANIEQLLRGWADRDNVNHRRDGGLPAPVHTWVGDLGCSPGLEARIRELLDPTQANLRNRIVHSGFLVTENKSFQDNIAIGDPTRYGFLLYTSDPYSPKNVANLSIRCLQDLDTELTAGVGLTAVNLGWAGEWCLSPDQLRFGRQIYCDLIPRLGGPTLEQAQVWRNHLSTYFRAIIPGLGQFFRLAFAGFMQPYSRDSYLYLHALGLIFEAVYRLTVHLLGVKILQETESGATLRFQYFMLDDENLCKPDILAQLCGYLDTPAERDMAVDTLKLAVQGRNSLAHGAVVRLDDPTFLGITHLFLKAIQLLVGAGEFHMTRQAAWYRWNSRRKHTGIIDGYHLEDWLTEEEAILDRIASAGRL